MRRGGQILYLGLFFALILACQVAEALSLSEQINKLLSKRSHHREKRHKIVDIASINDDTFKQVSDLEPETVSGEKETVLILA